MLKCKNYTFSLTCCITVLPDFNHRWLNLFCLVDHRSCWWCCVSLNLFTVGFKLWTILGLQPRKKVRWVFVNVLHCSSSNVLNQCTVLPWMMHQITPNICRHCKIFHSRIDEEQYQFLTEQATTVTDLVNVERVCDISDLSNFLPADLLWCLWSIV